LHPAWIRIVWQNQRMIGGDACNPELTRNVHRRLVQVAVRRYEEMTRSLPPPWRAEKFSGGYVVRDANGFAVAYVYGRSTEAEAMEAKQMTMDEARRVASNIAKLPGMLQRGD
jgi:hypothetical protein